MPPKKGKGGGGGAGGGKQDKGKGSKGMYIFLFWLCLCWSIYKAQNSKMSVVLERLYHLPLQEAVQICLNYIQLVTLILKLLESVLNLLFLECDYQGISE